MQDLVEQAIAFEDRGKEFYERAFEKSNHPLARALFKNLALDEETHAQWIRDLQGSLDEDEAPDGPSLADRDPIEKRVRDAFDRMDDRAASVDDRDNVEGVEMAIKLEKEAISMYRDLIDKDPSPREKKFLQKILKEERKHQEALRNVHAYLTSTDDWFYKDESQRWNWMNI